MKKALSFFAVLWCLASTQVWAYDFSAVSPSGHTLYYYFLSNGSGVTVASPNWVSSSWWSEILSACYSGYSKPIGDVVIPSVVSHNGVTYTVKRIGNGAFAYCDSITSITIPSTIETIGSYAFLGTSSMTTMNFNAENCQSFGAIEYLLQDGYGNYYTRWGDLYNQYYQVYYPAFTYDALYINSEMFFYTDYWYTPSLTTINIGNNVRRIPDYAFAYLGNITSVNIPNSIEYIGKYAFLGTNIGDTLTLGMNGNGNLYVGKKAFESTALAAVNLGPSVMSLGKRTFNGCLGLTSVNLGTSLSTISDSCFSNCVGITTVNIPNSVDTIDNGAFAGCSSLTSLNLGNGVKYIGKNAFYDCGGLTGSLVIPKNVSYIGDGAFFRSSFDTVFFYADNAETGFKVYRPYSFIQIEISPFYYREFSEYYNIDTAIGNSITHFVFGDNVKSIPSGLCYGLSNLTSVTIPDSVTSIGGAAFHKCTGLTEIHSLNRVAPLLGIYTFNGIAIVAFDSVPFSIPVHIPCGSTNSYYSRWNYFSNFVEDEAFTFTATSANEQQGTVQILTMPTCTSPQAVVYAAANSGYHFDHWSDGSTSNPYSLTVTDDLDLIGYFVSDSGTEGISDVDADFFRIYCDNGRIVIEGAEGETTSIYDMMGRNIPNANLPAGVYMVKIGTYPARRVVVIR